MRSSIVGLAILGLWVGNSLARSVPDEDVEAFRKHHKWAPRAADEYGNPDPNWDENAALRDLTPDAFPSDDSSTHSKRSPLELEIASFNVHPGVVNNDPDELRKNPLRKHQEYFCYWRTPRPGFAPQNAYYAINHYLDNNFSMDMCSGPGGYCTPIYCFNHFVVAVCNWNKTPWQIRCMDLMVQARDLAVAMGNQFDELWRTGIDPHVSEAQKNFDRKKLCVSHSSVYTPEMLGYTFFNTNPQFQVQMYYGFPDDRITCDGEGQIFSKIRGNVKRQDDYEWDWFSVATDKKLDELEQEASKGDKKSGAKPDAVPNLEKNDTSGLPSPVDFPKDDGEGGADYKGPNLKDYDPVNFIPPDQVNQWQLEQWQKSHSAEIASASKEALEKATRLSSKNYTIPTAVPYTKPNAFPKGYTKSVQSAVKAGYKSQAAHQPHQTWTGSGYTAPTADQNAQMPMPTFSDAGIIDTPPLTDTAGAAGTPTAGTEAPKDTSKPNSAATEPPSSTAVAASRTSENGPVQQPSTNSTRESSAAPSSEKPSATTPPSSTTVAPSSTGK
ncbi:hypothetical protein ABW21_db0208043 [Orbilia brochopaga]|nr:hypothetical protein ABW21_db0208043 [Drechslerella brochopaga]